MDFPFAHHTKGQMMTLFTTYTRRSFIAAAAIAGALFASANAMAQAPKEIRVDYATYNPVSLVLKERGILEKALASEGVALGAVRRLQQGAGVPQRRLA
jgi:hypothetical protein